MRSKDLLIDGREQTNRAEYKLEALDSYGCGLVIVLAEVVQAIDKEMHDDGDKSGGRLLACEEGLCEVHEERLLSRHLKYDLHLHGKYFLEDVEIRLSHDTCECLDRIGSVAAFAVKK